MAGSSSSSPDKKVSKWQRRLEKLEKLRNDLVTEGYLKRMELSERKLAKLALKLEKESTPASVCAQIKVFLRTIKKLRKKSGKIKFPSWLKVKDGDDKTAKSSKKRERTASEILTSHDDKRKRRRNEEENKKDVDKSGVSLLLFYAYIEPEWDEPTHKRVIKWAKGVLEGCKTTGRLRIAKEGLNGTLTGPYDGLRQFASCLRAYDPENFSDVDFKFTDGLPEGQRFPELRVFAVDEIVKYGLGGDRTPSIKKHGGVHLMPKDYHKKMEEPNTVIIDVRNSYEAAIGRFNPPKGGAEYIDPKMRLSTEFPDFIDKNLEKLKDKQVMMFCTGGIRCERASAYLNSKGHTKGVFQCQGGIDKYLKHFEKDGGYWIGKNYTFDKRFAHGASGVVGTEKETIVGECVSCGKEWDKYRGKRRCPQCAVPLLICYACQSKDKHKSSLCALCKEDKANGKLFKKTGDAPDVTKKQLGVRHEAKAAKVNECGRCGEKFKSRNALFRHVKETGHFQKRRKRKQQ